MVHREIVPNHLLDEALLADVFLQFLRRHQWRISSPYTPASSFLLPGCLKARRRIQRLPLCTEPAPKCSVASENFVSEPTWLMHLCFFFCEASVFWRFAASDLSAQIPQVSVYPPRRFHLLVKVFESQLLFSVL